MIAAALTLVASEAVAVIVIVVLLVGMAYALVWSLAFLDYLGMKWQQRCAARQDKADRK